MKRAICVLLAMMCMFAICACKAEKEDVNGSANVTILTKSDVVTQKVIKTVKRVYTFDKVRANGKCKVTHWVCTYTNKQDFEFRESEEKHEDIIVDEKTNILMGDIMNYKGEAFDLYNQDTTLEYFLDNAEKEYDGKRLYFVVKLTDNHADTVELFWDYYFKVR
ncbi:MAG: hypothetical protein IJO93_04475 [Clostridia bacterium]|nr:hypothetical protein [Clostridia bacterium]